MRKILIALMTALTLTSCGDPSEAPKPTAPHENSAQAQAQAQNNNKVTVYFPDGSGALFSAHSNNEKILEGKNGQFQRYVLKIPAELKILEASTFEALADSGYTRKILRDEPPVYAVSYIKKGFARILATYKELKPHKDGTPNTQLVMTWRIKN